MLKKLLVIALSVVALAAAGCGGGDKQAQTTIKVPVRMPRLWRLQPRKRLKVA